MSGFYGRTGYVYTISTQGHGAYPEKQLIDDPEITVTGAATERRTTSGSITAMRSTKWINFVKELTDALADYPEDVSIGYVRRSPSNNGTLRLKISRIISVPDRICNMGQFRYGEKEGESLGLQMAAE